VLLEGVPGLAKTLLVRSLGATLRCSFSRIQFTPDLMPADVTGVSIYDSRKGEFELRRGPLFADLVLADEINRTPAKTQSALLEAMQEGQISIDGQTHALPEVFMVVATQNPIESEGTYPLPEAQLDRFLLKVLLDYPTEADERAMLSAMNALGLRSRHPESAVQALAGPQELLAWRRLGQDVRVDSSVQDYILALIRGSRTLSSLSLGCSPRAAIMLLNASKALAVLRGRDFVSPDEVQAMALPVMRHRVQLTPEAEIEGLRPDDCLHKLLAQVPVPR
jgi:MoxR-like ATPase